MIQHFTFQNLVNQALELFWVMNNYKDFKCCFSCFKAIYIFSNPNTEYQINFILDIGNIYYQNQFYLYLSLYWIFLNQNLTVKFKSKFCLINFKPFFPSYLYNYMISPHLIFYLIYEFN